MHLSRVHRCSVVVHIIELSSADDTHHDGAVPRDVLVNLTSRSRTSSVEHAVLVLKADNPVHWHVNIQRLHCSIDVVVSNRTHSHLLYL